MHLPENLRENLKRPMGLLIRDAEATKENILKNMVKGALLISVGDATTEKLVKFGLDPSVQIVDSVEKRRKRDLPEGKVRTTLHCTNPAAEITPESMAAIKRAFREEKPVRIVVTGEEDLLVLPVVVYAPENSIVMYGQPNEGLVIVTINQKVRNTAKKFMDSMT